MAESFEDQDLSGATFWGVDLSGAHFRDVDLGGVTLEGVRLVDVNIDGLIDRVTINGVDVTAYVNERDPWYPLRSMLTPPDPHGMRVAWSALQERWTATIAQAVALPDEKAYESVDGEFSFVETVRHLVFAMDKWFTAPILAEGFHPMGLPNRGSLDFPWPGLDYELRPTLTEALAVRAGRAEAFRDYLTSVTPTELASNVGVLENGERSVRECVHVVLEEEFSHNRYATRDLAKLR